MPYRAAVIGCGKIGSEFADDPLMQGDVFTHAEAYVRCPDTELIAICDQDADKLERCGSRWSVPKRYREVKQLVEHETLDVVSVCTPDQTHYNVLREVLDGPHKLQAILCEKPFVTSVSEGEEIVDLARARGVTLAVVYMRRYAENIKAVRALIVDGTLGRIQAVAGWYTKGTLHNGTHWFDLLRQLAGEVEWVSASDVLGENVADPTLDVTLGLQGGAVASLRACDASRFAIFEMEIVCTRGRIRLVDSGHVVQYEAAQPSPRYSGYSELVRVEKEFGDRRNLMLHAVEDLVRALQTGGPVACSAEDGMAALKIAAAARKSAETGGVVRLREPAVAN